MTNTAHQIVEKLRQSKQVVITSHKSPDGDSIGSSLALYQFCKKLGMKARICHPDPAPKYLKSMPEADQIVNFEEHQAEVISLLHEADLIFSLDYNEPSRMGDAMALYLNQSNASKIMIDHHLNPSDFADIMWSDTSACSTCQLIFQLISESGNEGLLDETIAAPIYLGIMTDTGSFRFNSVKAQTHEIVAKLLKTGLKHDEIHELMDVNTLQRLRLRGYACSEKLHVLEKYPVAYISMTKQELNDFHYEKGDTEGLVNVALSIQGVKIAAFFSEGDDGIKISFRSKGKNNPVNELSGKYFSGGGHANAAGGKFAGSLNEAIDLFVTVVPDYCYS